jgi:predicted permease
LSYQIMVSLFAGIRSFLRVRRVEALNNDEETTRRSHLESGRAPSLENRGRRPRVLRPFDNLRFSMLDIRLSGRMLVKHPALTLVSTIAVAFAIAVGTVGFEVARQALWPSIPLPDGNAIVALRNWNAADYAPVSASRRDFELWRDGLTAISDFSAVELQDRNVAVGAGPGQPETIANVTASTFVLTRVPALMGRTLLETDERGNEGEVVVIGYDFWKNRLDGAADAVGRIIHISGAPVTIVGVMPRGYGFPKSNGVWRPLRLDRIPEISPRLRYVFGRVAPGHTREEAAAQVAAIGARAARMFPETHKNVRLQLLSLPEAVSYWDEHVPLVLASMNVFLVLLAALLSGNVAMLLFARAVSRERDLLVRAALGASRGRLIMQLFAEALLLCAIGAVIGLMVARVVLAATWTMIEGQSGPLPFWIDTSLSTTTILYASGLTLFAAAIAGIIPAVKVTSGGADRRLRAASSGGGGLQFGGVWTVVIVAQVALTTMLPVPLIGVGAGFIDARNAPAGFQAEAFLTATLAIDPPFDRVAASADTAPAMRLGARYRALAERLRFEPAVLDVTYADQMPLMRHRWHAIKVEGSPPNDRNDHCVPDYCASIVSVDPRFFDVIGARTIRGRTLTTADAEQMTRSVVVNRFFVDRILGGRNPIGQRIRLTSTPGGNPESWYQIVGVVPDLGISDSEGDWGRASVYQTRLPREISPLRVAIHVRGDPQSFAVRLRELAHAIDPSLRVIDPKPLPRLANPSAFWFELLISLTSVTLMLSLAGVYAVTAFAVSRRTREIGVRVALGARPLQILTMVFRRPLIQIALGVGIGAILALGIANNDLSDVQLEDFGRSAVFALSTILFCALACVVPALRALRIQPTEALKADA